MLVLVGVVIGAVLSYFIARVERVSLERYRQMSAVKAIVAEIREVQKIAQDPSTTLSVSNEVPDCKSRGR